MGVCLTSWPRFAAILGLAVLCVVVVAMIGRGDTPTGVDSANGPAGAEHAPISSGGILAPPAAGKAPSDAFLRGKTPQDGPKPSSNLPNSAVAGLSATKPAKPAADSVAAKFKAAFPDAPAVQVLVLTYKRVKPLGRLLKSLKDANYTGLPPHHLRVCVDRPAKDPVHTEVLDSLKDFDWPHGNFEVGLQREHQALAGQWINCWDGASMERQFAPSGSPPMDDSAASVSMVLEDDMDVSPQWAQWQVRAGIAYRDNKQIQGFSLQRPQIRAVDAQPVQKFLPSGQLVVGYRLLGSWGYGAYRSMWRKFVAWQKAAAAADEDPSVPGLVMSRWWANFKRTGRTHTMWTMWFIKYCADNDVFTLFGNLGGRNAWGANWREAGEHFSGKSPGPDSDVIKVWKPEYGVFPEKPYLMDWSGEEVKLSRALR